MKALNILKSALLVGAASLGVATGAHAAATINQMFFPAGQTNTIQDSDAEWVRDATGSVKTTGDFVKGDTIVANLLFDTVNGTTINSLNGIPSLTYQLMAYSELLIDSIVDNTATTGTYRLNFASSLGSGVMAKIYEGDPSSFLLSQAPTTGTTNMMSETLIATFGLETGGDDFWYADVASLDLTTIAAALSTSQAAIGTFGLSLLSNPGSLPVGKNAILGADGNMHDLVGTASAYKLETGVNSGYLVSSNLEARFVTAVPEPGSLALVGLALVGLTFAARRRSA